MVAENDRTMMELAHARKRYADHARARFGREAIELFSYGGRATSTRSARDHAERS